VCARKDRHSDCIGVFLYRRLNNLFWSLVKPGVNDFKSRIAKRPSDHFGAAIMTI
jgi:hypothetical protein